MIHWTLLLPAVVVSYLAGWYVRGAITEVESARSGRRD